MTRSLFAGPVDREPDMPVPPLRLRRIRLHGVGPDGARFDPLDLDFVTSDGAAARVLLSLTNTGGKSTLITLVCSLVVPASRAQVGGKVLGDYVLTGDTSHVVCEWEDVTSGRRTVTGAVMEWKDGRRQPPHASRSTSNMHRSWYLFHTGPGLPGVDDLPFVVDGRRLPHRAFCDAVDDLIADHPGTQGVLTDKQQAWTTALEERTSVDPTLFGYQMRMNDSEAGAEKLLASFDSPDNVVRFFVAALNDHRELETFTQKLEDYSALASQRTELEAIAGFGAEITPGIELIVSRSAVVDVAAARSRRSRLHGGEHAAALVNRIHQDEESLGELQKALDAARGEANKARYAYGQISDIRQQLQLEEARARVASTRKQVELAEAATAEARRHEQAWRAVDVVIDLETARQARDAAKLAYKAADAGLEPLRERVTDAAERTAGRLDALVAESSAIADAADVAAGDAAEDADRAQQDKTTATLELERVDRELGEIKKQNDDAETATAAAVSVGWLNDGERASACVSRWQEVRGEANLAADGADEAALAADRTYDSLGTEIDILDKKLVELRATAQRAAARLNDHDTEFGTVSADETVVHLIGARPESTVELARAKQMAEESARAADRRAAEHKANALAANEELAQLDEAGTAPAGSDALAVLGILTEARIGAVTGLSWIERNIADSERRAPFIAENPDLAGGVVISDPQRFTDGVALLVEKEVRTRTPVTVRTAPTSTTGPRPETVTDARRHVVVPHRATWDRAWALETRKALEETALAEGDAHQQAAAAAQRYRDVVALCSGFLRRWGETSRDELARMSTEAADILEAEDSRRDALVADRKAQRTRAAEARADAKKYRGQATMADGHVARATRLAEVVQAAEVATARVAGLTIRRGRAREELRSAGEAIAAAAEMLKNSLQRAADARSAGETWARERAEMGVDEAALNSEGNLQVLRDAWHALRAELAAAEHGMIEAELLKRAESDVGKAVGRTRQFDDRALADAEVLATTGEAASPGSRIRAQQRVGTSLDSARAALVTATTKRKQAEDDLAEAQPAGPDHQNFIDLSTTDWAPATPEDIPRLQEKLEIRNVELREIRDGAEQAERDADELVRAVQEDIASLGDTLDLWPVERIPTTHVFHGTRVNARDLMKQYVQEQRETDGLERAARDDLHTAVVAARSTALDSRWSGLDAAAAMRVRSLSEADLVTEAEVLARRIRAMAGSAADDLRELDDHRAILRDSLLSLCRDQRRMLREVTRSAKLPDGLGDLSQQSAIKIRFDDAPDDEAAARLVTRIDTWAVELSGNPKRAKSSEVRARWLADAVRDTVLDRTRAGAWSIEILKPSIDGRVLYCPPDRIPIEFSGGQVLTLAVLVYCALSRVRSAHRQGGPRPAGTLLLDNPFGAASAEALIQMQHRLAAHSGVQLVCATGLHDPAVDAAFTGTGSVIMKLRNDGDLRRNLSYLRLRATTVDGVDVAESITGGRDRAATRNWVDATRYEIRG
ncbi:hypothetical protein [Amycolatopsis sp. GM8]|uniref:hypothetical protein n=1 Tax=Amycolatopsis sp. GM8 TaxID=2896530 RepID=UPI001F309BBC|nr:hypothetical protein [Amycolatopsis sp. GM8]